MTLIRHSKTHGNIERRYIGKTDEPLCEEGIDELISFYKKGVYPKARIIFSSPLKRCLQKVDIIYKSMHPIIFEELGECDFGAFEGKCYNDLKDDSQYAAWLENGGNTPFPCGEDKEAFKLRCARQL